MAFNTCCKYYNGLAGSKTHSTPFPTFISLGKKKRKKKKTILFSMSSVFRMPQCTMEDKQQHMLF